MCCIPTARRCFEGIEAILAMANRTSAETEVGQNDLFGGLASAPEDVRLAAARAMAADGAAGAGIRGGRLLSLGPSARRLHEAARQARRRYLGVVPREGADKGATAGKLAGTVTHRQERRSKSGNKFAFVGFSDPTGQFEAICFSDTLAVSRDLLEPGKAVIARVEADVDGEEVKLCAFRASSCSTGAAARSTAGLTIFVRDAKPIDSIAQRLANGGRAPVRLILQMDKGREVEIALGDKFTVTPQIKGAIKAIPGVIDVQDL